MQLATISRIIGILLMLFSLSMVIPVGVAEFFGDGAAPAFIFSFVLTLATGFSLWWRFRHCSQALKIRDGFLIVILFWTVLSLFGSLPLFIAHHPYNSFTNAIFESVSGLTTTGATVITNINNLSHAIRFYRLELQFMGGMGIVVLAVAILPMLGVGGMQLYRTETPGPMKDNKLTPRITQTAKALWVVYMSLTLACALCYWAAGMHPFDAICDSFSTVATGGFSVHNASIAYYNSYAIDLIATVFMFLGSVNFTLHYMAITRHKIGYYWRDYEFRVFLFILLVVVILTIAGLFLHGFYPTISGTVVKGLFTAVSFATTTGLSTTNYNDWPTYLPLLLMLVAIIGGCAGSTSGGIKVMRFVLLIKQSVRELNVAIHPKGIFPTKFGKQQLSDRMVQAMWGYISIFVALLAICMLLLMATGLDLRSAFSASVAMLSNTGIALGSVANNYEHVSEFGKWVCIFFMLAGRLEIFSLLVLFTKGFWRG